MIYPVEEFTPEEEVILNRYFSNIDQPVFAIQNLPEVVKGAMFARYSRYAGSLRRMFLDEFTAELGSTSKIAAETDRAAGLYERIFVGYGDDSVAQVGGAHLACEYTSNILTKLLQRGRLAAYLEQSTRYIAYDSKMPDGQFRYYNSPELGSHYTDSMNAIFSIYSKSLPVVINAMAERYPINDEPEAAWRNSLKAKALDLMRGLLPAASLSHMGIFASGQAYEQLILRLLASPLPEARDYGERMLKELKTVIPSFLSRIERPERGGRWVEYLQERRDNTEAAAARYGLADYQQEPESASVTMIDHRGTPDDLIEAGIYEAANTSQLVIREAISKVDSSEKAIIIKELNSTRENRRHRPSRGFETVSYRFEIVSDYGAFRDLQRHRMLNCQWQTLTPDLGADIPDELPDEVKEEYARGLNISAFAYENLMEAGLANEAPYALALGYKLRYILDMNAREAMQLTELRSAAEGHPAYRAVAQEMHRQITEVHPEIGAAMEFVDHSTEPRLERILSEIRNQK